jgi:hypothetical protein
VIPNLNEGIGERRWMRRIFTFSGFVLPPKVGGGGQEVGG